MVKMHRTVKGYKLTRWLGGWGGEIGGKHARFRHTKAGWLICGDVPNPDQVYETLGVAIERVEQAIEKERAR